MGRIIQGDALEELKKLPDEFVQCVVTSPPYWGLRDYGTAKWKGGNRDCDHKVSRFEYSVSKKQASNSASAGHQAKNICPKCGAKRVDLQIGLEKTPEEYVEKLVAIFREVKRVLRKDGTVFLNLGDCYNSSPSNLQGKGIMNSGIGLREGARLLGRQKRNINNLKTKDLVGIPWRVAFALQSDGWWLRQDIIWHKPNPMPEPVTDRCTKAHEYIFLLTKSANYYWDQEAIKEPAAYDGRHDTMMKGSIKYKESPIPNQPEHTMAARGHERWKLDAMGNHVRNRRSVWTIATQPSSEPHFAQFPEKLVEPCVLAGSKEESIVLDPFCGLGTACIVAKKLGRDYIGIDVNPKYCKRAEQKLENTGYQYAINF